MTDLDRALARRYQPVTDIPPQGEEELVNLQAADRAGLKGKFAQHGVFLELATGDCLGVSYGAIVSPFTYNPSKGISFRYQDQDKLFEVEITGYQLKEMAQELTWGFRQSVRVNDDKVTAITVTEVKAEE